MNTSTKTITASISAFATTVANGSQFDFTISTLGNPISLEPVTMRSITYLDSSGNIVNTYANAITITNTNEGAFTGASLGQTTNVASNAAIYTFSFTPANAIPTDAIIQLIYPSTVSPSSSLVCTGVGGIPSGTVLDCSTINTATRSITIK